MKPLILLITVFLISVLVTRIFQGRADYSVSGRIAMSVMLVFTTIGHFKFAEGMSLMIPGSIPYKKELIYLTGFIEIAAAVGILIASVQVLTGWLLIAFFLVILPANIFAAMKGIDYEKATYDGPGSAYLWFRIPLQIFFIAWVYWFVIKDPTF